MIRLFALTVTLMLAAAAPPNPDPALTPFYQGLRQPGTEMSCCSIADCRNVQYRMAGNAFEIYVDRKQFANGTNTWVVVPADKVLKAQANPTGEGVACWSQSYGVMCFLQASGT